VEEDAEAVVLEVPEAVPAALLLLDASWLEDGTEDHGPSDASHGEPCPRRPLREF
jgi:hypothetical protein